MAGAQLRTTHNYLTLAMGYGRFCTVLSSAQLQFNTTRRKGEKGLLRTDADRSFEPAILRLSTLPDRLWSPHGIYLIEDVALQSDVCSLVLQSLQTFGCNLENESHISNTSFHFHSSTGFPIKDARLLKY